MIELQYAFGLADKNRVRKWLQPLLENGILTTTGRGEFVEWRG
ncbi:hypothetical protein [Rodentibacter myodis]|nr:hypothetical protein [Rodentibacter myodis]